MTQPLDLKKLAEEIADYCAFTTQNEFIGTYKVGWREEFINEVVFALRKVRDETIDYIADKMIGTYLGIDSAARKTLKREIKKLKSKETGEEE